MKHYNMENLKNKLKVKPTEITKKKVEIVFKGVQVKGVVMNDMRNKSDIDIDKILEQVKGKTRPGLSEHAKKEEALTQTQIKLKKLSLIHI